MADDALPRWRMHLAAIMYLIPLPVALVMIDLRVFAFWAGYLPITVLALVLIYGWRGRYRQYARLYPLAGGLSFIGVLIAGHSLPPSGVAPDLIVKLALWCLVLVSCTFIGAFALMPGRAALWLTRTIWTPIYPESVLPQEIKAVEPEYEPGDEDDEQSPRAGQ